MYAHTYNRSSWVFIALVIFSQLYYEEGRREKEKESREKNEMTVLFCSRVARMDILTFLY